ncbi:MAG TPA: diguanylate cyclase [Syntrophomonas sp.]|nr:diguanylate cyclase [Syntrophomonas sp.]
MNRPKRQGTAHSAENFNKNQPARVRFRLYLVLVLLAGLLFIAYTYLHYIHRSETEAINLAQAFEAFIGLEILDELEATPADIDKPAYSALKEELTTFVERNGKMRFAYLFVYHDGRVYFLADSEPPESPAYSPPGQAYDGYSEQDFNRLRQGESIITPLVKDQWGTWVTVTVPVINPHSGQTLAAFGIDYPAWQWYAEPLLNTGYAAALVIGLLLAFNAYYRKTVSNELLRQERDKLAVMTRKLGESEELFRRVFEKAPIGIAIVSDFRFISVMNQQFEQILGRSFTELAALNWKEMTHPDDLPQDLALFAQFKAGQNDGYEMDKRFIKPDGKAVWVKMIIAPLTFDEQGLVREYLCLLEDITERYRMIRELQESERSLLYTNAHDYLTGLYNRRYFEAEKLRLDRAENLPLSVIIADINGLKLINDALGHEIGDQLIRETARVMAACCREGDMLARTGGDEFTILMPNTSREEAQALFKQIESAFRDEFRIQEENYMSVSLGFDTKESWSEDINQVIKSAEDIMYRRKLLEHKSSHGSIIAAMKSTMFNISHETEAHANRLLEMSRRIGARLQLSNDEMGKLELLATLHDIGKLGIDRRVLNKETPLNEEEWKEMRKHPEIGFRIAMSTHELMPIAEYILSHHERWDGSGYPQGLAGENIPLLSRILSVIDAYDAMTSDRVYRHAVSREEALEELKQFAGTQFDPRIVEIFINASCG